ncbi:hypothetical protein FAM09_02345 [Niastella caeni]|uniref:Uncharacterized protein n=1 Tax=Niastella caeni TaxID=2569763 RepID=A0A4S8HYS3_9BACT|nr:hypothetical protein [Niastella caeni]THU40978.1 hypothetical protein FAM09_02345 [Niastella caeni]
MKSILVSLVSLASFIGQGYGQSAEGQEFGEDIRLWLKPGEHKVELMSIKSTVNPRQLELTSKIMKAAQKNAAWIRDSMATVTDSAIIYAKFGLTKAEYNEYIAMDDTDKKQELVKTGDETLVIKRKKNTLTFRGTGRLKALDSLKFNVVLNEPIYNGMELEFGNKSGSEDSNNPFKSPWTGYHYTYEMLDDIDANMTNFSTTKITFDIGQLKNGKSIIMFMLLRVKDGKPIQNATAICLFE